MPIKKQLNRIFKQALKLASYEFNEHYLTDKKNGSIYQEFLATSDGSLR